MESKLSIVGTPIGNLEDMTYRAVRTLKEADLILCEDTRVTKKLLGHYEIDTPVRRCDAHIEAQCATYTVEFLKEGRHVAYVSDAGTPGVSDPGALVVARVRTELPEVTIEVVPGASSVTAALSLSGLQESLWTFLGFAPHKKGRQTFFKMLSERDETVVFFESPHRIEKTLEALTSTLDPKRMVLVCRELTKVHEEVVSGSSAEVARYFKEHADHVRGEFVVVVAPPLE